MPPPPLRTNSSNNSCTLLRLACLAVPIACPAVGLRRLCTLHLDRRLGLQDHPHLLAAVPAGQDLRTIPCPARRPLHRAITCHSRKAVPAQRAPPPRLALARSRPLRLPVRLPAIPATHLQASTPTRRATPTLQRQARNGRPALAVPVVLPVPVGPIRASSTLPSPAWAWACRAWAWAWGPCTHTQVAAVSAVLVPGHPLAALPVPVPSHLPSIHTPTTRTTTGDRKRAEAPPATPPVPLALLHPLACLRLVVFLVLPALAAVPSAAFLLAVPLAAGLAASPPILCLLAALAAGAAAARDRVVLKAVAAATCPCPCPSPCPAPHHPGLVSLVAAA